MILDQLDLPHLKAAFNTNKVDEQLTRKINLHFCMETQPLRLNLRGGAGRKLFCSFFNPLISLFIYYDQYEKIWREKKKICLPAFRFHGNGGHL